MSAMSQSKSSTSLLPSSVSDAESESIAAMALNLTIAAVRSFPFNVLLKKIYDFFNSYIRVFYVLAQ